MEVGGRVMNNLLTINVGDRFVIKGSEFEVAFADTQIIRAANKAGGKPCLRKALYSYFAA